jgi:hypothetical protein
MPTLFTEVPYRGRPQRFVSNTVQVEVACSLRLTYGERGRPGTVRIM